MALQPGVMPQPTEEQLREFCRYWVPQFARLVREVAAYQGISVEELAQRCGATLPNRATAQEGVNDDPTATAQPATAGVLPGTSTRGSSSGSPSTGTPAGGAAPAASLGDSTSGLIGAGRRVRRRRAEPQHDAGGDHCAADHQPDPLTDRRAAGDPGDDLGAAAAGRAPTPPGSGGQPHPGATSRPKGGRAAATATARKVEVRPPSRGGRVS